MIKQMRARLWAAITLISFFTLVGLFVASAIGLPVHWSYLLILFIWLALLGFGAPRDDDERVVRK